MNYSKLVIDQQAEPPTDTLHVPPKMSSVKYKTFRSHSVTMVLRLPDLPSQCLISVVKYGCKLSNVFYNS